MPATRGEKTILVFSVPEQRDFNWFVGFIVVTLGLLGYASYNAASFFTEETQSTDPMSDGKAKIARTSARGTMASLLSVFAVSVFLQGFFKNKALLDGATTSILLGLMFGGTYGFILDQAIGQDEGYGQDTMGGQFRYAFGSLATAKYGRYMVTVLIDLFLSAIMLKHLQDALVTLPFFRHNRNTSESLVNVIVGVVTFQAYANLTRFTWAYPSTSAESSSLWLNPDIVQLLTSITAVLFLCTDTVPNPPEGGKREEVGINHPLTKILITLAAILIMFIMGDSMRPSLDVSVEPDNLFIGVSSEELDETELTSHKKFDKGEALPAGNYHIVKLIKRDDKTSSYTYRLVGDKPKFKFKKKKTTGEPSDDYGLGIGIFMGLAALTGGYTFMMASGKKEFNTRLGYFALFMAYAFVLTIPAYA